MRQVAAGAMACLLSAGCGSLQLGTAAQTGAAGRGAPTAARNRELAEQEAVRLLSLAPVPGEAVPLGSAPRSLPGPAMGTPGVSSLIDQVRSWRVPMPLSQSLAWLQAHHWQSAELEIAVAPAGSGASIIRADGVVVWLDPSPVPDTMAGPRMRVTVAGGCPGSDAQFAGVSNRGTDLARRLLPAAEPTAGLQCRYYGMNGLARRLRTATRLNLAAARRVARAMAGLLLSHVDGARVSCPADDGSAEVVALSYPDRADVDLWIKLNGCGGVTNGYIAAGLPG